VRLGIHRAFDRKRQRKWRRFLGIAALSLLSAWNAALARAQEWNRDTANTSDLAMQNLSRVAASSEEIKIILAEDAGLMVELKHLSAKECD
jgi:hypothetical protein